jgi:hypothetical protein
MKDFFEYNDIGLPIAYAYHNDMITLNDQSEMYVEETYHLLVFSLGIDDKEYQSLDEMLEEAEKQG